MALTILPGNKKLQKCYKNYKKAYEIKTNKNTETYKKKKMPVHV